MSLRTVSFQDTYWSGENDLIKEFYVPCMEESVEYCRAVGYFHSSIFCYITNGLYPFIQNGGRIRIVCSVNVSPEDERQIALGYDIRQLLEDKIAPVTQELIDLNISNIKNLCWLIKNNRLDIKVCLRKDSKAPDAYRLFHEKFGIFKDADGNAISFLGSVNETLGGWINNEESFCSATSFLRNWDSILEKKRANLRSISEPARLRQPPPQKHGIGTRKRAGSKHTGGATNSRPSRAFCPLVGYRLLSALYGPFCGPLRPFGGCP